MTRHPPVQRRPSIGWTTILAALLVAFTGWPASAAIADDWRDLHDRCETAILADAPLDTVGLVSTGPDFLFEEVEDDVFGTRFELKVARISARTVPMGIWRAPGSRLEMRLIEYPTRAGTRAICEIRRARGAAGPNDAERETLKDAFTALGAGSVTSGVAAELEADADRVVMTYAHAGPRGCDVVASLRHAEGLFRASVAERAGDPTCGGHSLLAGMRARQIEGESR